MKVNLRRGFNRLFVVLTAAWIVYCLIVYPIKQRAESAYLYDQELRHCYEQEKGKVQDLQGCADYAMLKSAVDEWSLTAFYKREWWALVLAISVVPLFAYAVLRSLLELGLWVARGFVSSS